MKQMRHHYNYGAAYRTSLQVNWQIDDIIGGEQTLDFRRPFLPEVLVNAAALDFLSAPEQLVVNHIRSHSYLSLFGLVEEYIVPFLVEHTHTRVHKAPPEEMRALFHFGEEECKHIELFQRFGTEFRQGFGTTCQVIGPAAAIASAILSKSPLGVALSILHIEWLTQLHYVASVKDNQDLDPQFCSLLRHHWLEEAQHAKLDTLMVGAIAATLREEEIGTGIDDYLAVGGMLDAGFTQQIEFERVAFTAATGRQLSTSEAECYRAVQQQSYRKTFLTAGMRHPHFQETLTDLSPEGARHVLEVATALLPMGYH
jgi:hypothetical protein